MKLFEIKKILISIIVLFILLCSSVTMFFLSVERLNESKKWERETYELMHVLHEIYIQTLKVENESRGYLITENMQFDDSLNRFAAILRFNIGELKKFSFEDNDHNKIMHKLELLVIERIDLAQSVNQLSKNYEFEDSEKMTFIGKGNEITNNIIQYTEIIEKNQKVILKNRIKNNENIQNIIIKAGYFGISLFILLLAFVIVNIISNKRKLTRSEAEKLMLNIEIEEKSKQVTEINNSLIHEIEERKLHQENLLNLNKSLEIANRELELQQIELKNQNEQLRLYQLELDYSREKYIKLYTYAPVGYISINKEGLIIECNLLAMNLIGGEKIKLINQQITHFIFNEDQDIFNTHLQQIFEKQTNNALEIRMIKTDSSIFYVHLRFVLSVSVENNTICNLSVADISERIQAQAELKKSEEKYRELFKNSQVGMFRSKIDGTELSEVNNKFSQIFGYSIEEMIGKPANSLFKDIKKRESIINDLYKYGFVNEREVDLLASNGKVITCLVSYKLLPDKETIEGSLVDISERKLFESKLQISENKFRKLFESSFSAIILIGADKKIKLVNKQAEDYFGYSKIELIGESIEKLVPHSNEINHPKLTSDFFKNPDSREMGKGRELFGLRKDGTMFPVEVGLNSIQLQNELSVMAFIVDITERKASEDQLAILFTSLNAVANAIVITDITGKITWVNPAFTLLTGYSSTEAINSDSNLLKSDKQDKKFYSTLWDTIKSAKVWHGELINKRKDGSEYFEEMTITPVTDKNKKILRFIAVKQDITFRKNTEKQLLISKEEAEYANQAKSIFIANISHEIRTPMNAIIGFSEILSKQVVDKVQKGYLNSIKTSSNTLLQLINNVLDLSKIEAGKVEIVNPILNIRFLITEMESMFTLKIKEKCLKLIFEIDPALPEFVELNDLRIRQVLINLISNAIKFTHKGYIKIKVISKLKGNNTDVEFCVEDTGIGMSESDRNMIFKAFNQGDEIVARKYGGTGLGLTISKKIVELHGGTIDFISEKGKGTTFFVKFFDIKILKPNLQKHDYIPVNTELIQFDNAKILIVDDDELNRNVVKGYLEQYKFEMKEAENGRVALEILKNFIPDVILMDIRMPELDGIKTVKFIRQNSAIKSIPIIALTASAFNNSLEKVQKQGFDGLVSKPFQQVEIVEELMKYIKNKTNDSDKSVNQNYNGVFDIKKLKNPFGVCQYIEDNVTPLLNSIKTRQTKNDVHIFANIVKQLGQQFEEPFFVELSNEILEYIDSFNVSGLKMTLDEFDAIIINLKDLKKNKTE